MLLSEMKNLKRGDIVRPIGCADSYLVCSNYGERVTVVRTMEMTKQREWDVIFKANHERVGD